MRLLINTGTHYFRDNKGRICCPTGMQGYTFFERYLSVFSEVVVVGRVSDWSAIGGTPVEGCGVRVAEVPDFYGPIEYLRRRSTITHAIDAALDTAEAVIIRAGTVGNILYRSIVRKRRRFGIEVGGDPAAVFEAGVVDHPLRPFIRAWAVRTLREQCWRADAVSYVSSHILPQRYPARPDRFQTVYSTVDLPDEAFGEFSRIERRSFEGGRLIVVGSLQQPYKGLHILIPAIASCLKSGLPLTLDIVGDGKMRPALEGLVTSLGLSDVVKFRGRVPAGAEVRKYLDSSDLFILPSLTEGLPRAVVEAMARGLPCIGTTVGGVPELLASDDLVPPGNVDVLADRICQVISDPQRMQKMAIRNFRRAQSFSRAVLMPRRAKFYHVVRDACCAERQLHVG